MRKGCDREKKMVENNDENSGPLSSLPVDRLTATDCNADRSCQFKHERQQSLYASLLVRAATFQLVTDRHNYINSKSNDIQYTMNCV